MFKEVAKQVSDKFKSYSDSPLYKTVNGEDLVKVYLDNFKDGDDPIFITNSTHDCTRDKAFIERFGGLVAIKDGELVSMWDIGECGIYTKPFKAMVDFIKSVGVTSNFLHDPNEISYPQKGVSKDFLKIGYTHTTKVYTSDEKKNTPENIVAIKDKRTFYHYHSELGLCNVDPNANGKVSQWNDAVRTLGSFLEEVSIEDINLAIELANDNVLRDAKGDIRIWEDLATLKELYQESNNKRLFLYENSRYVSNKGYMGVLATKFLKDLREKGLDEACFIWNNRKDPINYRVMTRVTTTRQLEEDSKFIRDNGYEDSFPRKHAKLSDIDKEEIMFSRLGKPKTAGLFDVVKKGSIKVELSSFGENISIDKFMSDVLPNVKEMSIYFENLHSRNLVALTKGDGKNILNWSNPFSWTYKGGLAGVSEITKAVADLGGITDAYLTGSLTWNKNGGDIVDLDNHCRTPKGLVYFRSKQLGSTILNIDMVSPEGLGVEHIYDHTPVPGKYTFIVDTYSGTCRDGFSYQIKVGNEEYKYEYNNSLDYKQKVTVATVTIKENGSYDIEHNLTPVKTTNSSKVWNIDTMAFHDVTLVCTSPNHWGDNNQGNKHFFFFINDCKSDEELKAFHGENLNPEIRKVQRSLEMLAKHSKIQPAEEQLCGLGFNETVHNRVTVKCDGKLYNIQFG